MQSKPKKTVLLLTAGLVFGVACASLAKERLYSDLPLTPIVNERVYQQLQFNTQQQVMFETVRSRSANTLAVVEKRLGEVRATMDEELAKEAPDLRRVSELGTEVRKDIFQAIELSREARLRLYDQMSLQQKAIIRDELKERLQRLDRARNLLLSLLKADTV